MGKSRGFSETFYTRKFITEKEVKYFFYNFIKTTNIGKLYLLPEIHKPLYNVPGRLIISNKESIRVFSFSFKAFNVKWLAIIRDSGVFIDKMKSMRMSPRVPC